MITALLYCEYFKTIIGNNDKNYIYDIDICSHLYAALQNK